MSLGAFTPYKTKLLSLAIEFFFFSSFFLFASVEPVRAGGILRVDMRGV
jgi:hypothetical protein